MAAINLTEKGIQAAIKRAKDERAQVEIADKALPGLRLRIAASGNAGWVLGVRDREGKARRFALGGFPALGISAARDAAREMRVDVRKGADPIAEARKQREEAAKPKATPVTLRGLLDAYETIAVPGKKDGKGLRSWPEARSMIESVFSSYIEAQATGLEAPALQVTVDRHPSRSSAGAAVRYIRPVLAWGAKRALVTPGVAEALDQPEGAQRRRQRAFSREEMCAILEALDRPEAAVRRRDLPVPTAKRLLGILTRAEAYRAMFHLLFLTATRLNEASAMRWQDVDLDDALWNIPASKTDKALVIPLSRQAVALLRGRLMVDESGRALEPDPAGLVFATRSGGQLGNWDKYTKPIHAASNTTGWHRHDIRRSVATLLGNLGVPPHIVEIVQGHELKSSSGGERLGGTATVYNMSRYRAEHADALQRLADELDLIAAGEEKVVRLPLRA